MRCRTIVLVLACLAGGSPGQDDQGDSKLVQLRKQLRDGDARAQWRVMRRLVAIGKPAVKLLTALAMEVDAKKEPRTSARVAAEGLRRLGEMAATAVPKFREMYMSGGMAQARLALDVLGDLGPYTESPADVTQLVFQGRLRNRGVMARATARRRRTSVPTAAVVGCLLRLQWKGGDTVADLATHIAGASALHVEIGLERLLRLARSGEHGAQSEEFAKLATRALLRDRVRNTRFRLNGGNWGWGGSVAVDNVDRVRRLAAEILLTLRVTPSAEARVAMHAAMLSHPDPAVRQRHVLALGGVRAKLDRGAVATLASRLSDTDKLVAWDAITALGMIGAAAAHQLPRLKQLARGEDQAKAVRAQSAIRMIEREIARSRQKSTTKEPGGEAEAGRV